MAWAATHKVVLGCLAFAVFWVLAVFPAVPFLPIGRTAGSILGAALMVVFQVVTPNQAFDAVDLPILGLLFGTMVVSVYLERADLFKYLGSALSWRSRGAKDLLCRVCLLSAISSALFTNDTSCVVFTEFVLELCRQHNLPVQPFLMALACSSNIGSAATAIGNPQNLVIAVESKISFFKFLVGVLPAMVVGILVNTLLLLGFYWKDLSSSTQALPSPSAGQKDPRNVQMVDIESGSRRDIDSSGRRVQPFKEEDEEEEARGTEATAAAPPQLPPPPSADVEAEPSLQRQHTPADMDDLLKLEVRTSRTSFSQLSQHPEDEEEQQQQRQQREQQLLRAMSRSHRSLSQHSAPGTTPRAADTPARRRSRKLKRRVWKTSVYMVTLLMLVALLYGLNLSWSALTAAVALMVLDFSDAGPSLDQVSYSLLVFFSGMFITVDGFNRTGAPGQLWGAVEPHARINTVSGIALLSIVVVLLSNVASNVPTVLLLGSRVAASAAATPGTSVTRAWLMLAWVSTVAGNLTLVGSAANLIVSEQARRSEFRANLSFWNHLKFGLPSTLIVVAVGLPLIQSS